MRGMRFRTFLLKKKSTKRKLLGKGACRLGEDCGKGGFLRYKNVGHYVPTVLEGDFNYTDLMAYMVGVDLGCGNDRPPPNKRRRTMPPPIPHHVGATFGRPPQTSPPTNGAPQRHQFSPSLPQRGRWHGEAMTDEEIAISPILTASHNIIAPHRPVGARIARPPITAFGRSKPLPYQRLCEHGGCGFGLWERVGALDDP